MFCHKQDTRTMNQGFTLVELLVTMVLIAVVSSVFMVIFRATLFNSLSMQTDASQAVDLSAQSQRISMVLRGVTSVTNATATDLVVTSYFYPSDTYVSLLHYYITTDAKGNKKLVADLTPYSANPPLGTPITSQKRTFTIIDNYYSGSSAPLFTYLDTGNTILSLPITDLQTIKSIKVTLAGKTANGSNQVLSTQVSLRNRKTNL